ncbi:MAG: hypothetical protein ACFE9S_06335 [Candidatus Hermodarchaeota archaeon]
MDLTPDGIYEDLKKNKIKKYTAFDLLVSLVENSDNENIRLKAIENLEKFESNNESLYKFLENLLISDSNNKVRIAATKFLKKKFLDKAINPLKWAITHETDYECLVEIIQSLERIKNDESKAILVKKIKEILKIKYLNKEKRIENKKYKKVIKKIIKTKQIVIFTHNKLAEILINYLTIENLINEYSNVYYELDPQTGLITELDLSDYLEYEVKGTPFGWKNNIKSISEIIGLKYLKNLKKIDLSNNQIENIKELVNFDNLTHLILTNNKISDKENLEYFKKLHNLEYLDLKNNEIIKNIHLNEFNPRIRVLLKDSYPKIK